jgi:hypothetical protein
VLAVAAACGPSRPPSAALIFDLTRTDLPAPVTARLGSPLTRDEVARLEHVARVELQRAYAPFRIDLVDVEGAFWRVRVIHDVTPQAHAVASVGESVALGPLGGGGFVDLVGISVDVARYTPPAASRADMVDAIGRGIGRVAAHELGHQILGPASAHNDLDGHAYENGSSERAAQYYSELRWTTWKARLDEKLGTR